MHQGMKTHERGCVSLCKLVLGTVGRRALHHLHRPVALAPESVS
jgi:hypothetical protein